MLQVPLYIDDIFCAAEQKLTTSLHMNGYIRSTLLSEYAYVLRPGGIIYTISDVKDLHLWMVKHLDAHPLFVRIPDEELVSGKEVRISRCHAYEVECI